MSEGVAAFLLVAAVVLWLALPLLPAFAELRRPTDASPLDMVGQDSGELTHFAERFREYANARLADGGADVVTVESAEAAASLTARVGDVIVAAPDIRLPVGLVATMEIYGRGDLACGDGTVCRAMLVEGDLELGRDSVVGRWAHADGAVTACERATLYGRASSNVEIELGLGTRFERVLAPRIRTRNGDPAAIPFAPSAPHTMRESLPFVPANATRLAEGVLRLDGSLRIPRHAVVLDQLVVRGDLTVEDGARLSSLKVHGSIELGTDVRVTGQIVARRDVHIGAGAHVTGSVIAEGAVHVAPRSWIGTADRLATVTAPRIRLAPYVTIHGALATGDGLVEWPTSDHIV